MKKKGILKSLATIMGVMVVMILPTGCNNDNFASNSESVSNSGSKADETVTVRLADMSAAGGILFNYAQHAGLIDKAFEGYNVKIELSDFGSGPAQNEAFAAGQIDFSVMGNMPAITGVSNDYGYKILAISSNSDYWGALVATPDSGINEIADLKGKKVGTYIGGSWHYLTGVYLESAGLTFDDIELLNTTSETATGIRSGTLDAGVLAPATAQQLINEGSAKLIAGETDVGSFQAVCGAEKFTSENPELTKIVLNLIKDTLEYADEHQEDYLEFYEEKTGLDSTTIKETWDLKEYTARIPIDEEIKVTDDMIKWMNENELISNDTITGEDLFDLSFAEEAGL